MSKRAKTGRTGGAVNDLVAFLLARIAEDEAVARACEPLEEVNVWGKIVPETYSHSINSCASEDGYPKTRHGKRARWNSPQDSIGDHFSHWEPARVLAECEAKRRIVALHDALLDDELARGDASAYGANLMHTDVLRMLAQPYADHPDFREEWRV